MSLTGDNGTMQSSLTGGMNQEEEMLEREKSHRKTLNLKVVSDRHCDITNEHNVFNKPGKGRER